MLIVSRISRWIYFPLVFVAIYIGVYGITGQIEAVNDLLWFALFGLAVGGFRSGSAITAPGKDQSARHLRSSRFGKIGRSR
jgi:TctA family transporter